MKIYVTNLKRKFTLDVEIYDSEAFKYGNGKGIRVGETTYDIRYDSSYKAGNDLVYAINFVKNVVLGEGWKIVGATLDESEINAMFEVAGDE